MTFVDILHLLLAVSFSSFLLHSFASMCRKLEKILYQLGINYEEKWHLVISLTYCACIVTKMTFRLNVDIEY